MKTALITGAYRGLGYEVARQLSERGWTVIVTARRNDRGSAAAAKLKNALFLELDITDDSSVARAAKEVSMLDVLVNNAGIIVQGDQDVLTIRPEVVARTIATNALGALRVSQAFVPHLLKSPGGRIVNVSSGAGQQFVAEDGLHLGSGMVPSLRPRLPTTRTCWARILPFTRTGRTAEGADGSGRTPKTSMRSLHPGGSK